MFKSLNLDYIGASASFLCFLHCITTPLFFVVASCTNICCSGTPVWWQAVDYIFIVVSFVVILRISKCTKKWILNLMWLSWLSLFLFLLNEKIMFFDLQKEITYIPALLLVSLHIYNVKSCNNCEVSLNNNKCI
ncbi:MAG: MerC domain-containing protein [Bacteroidota bacterium]|nr:MerC domain-containing protein [Bacteroidota bacterium]